MNASVPLTYASRFISTLFLPVLVPLWGLLYFFQLPFFTTLPIPYLLIGVVGSLFFGFLLPVLSYRLLYEFNVVSNPWLPLKEDRLWPYVLTALFLCGGAYFLRNHHYLPCFYLLLVAGAAACIVAAIINLKFRISAHLLAMGCWLGCVTHVLTQQFQGIMEHPAGTFSVLLLLCGVVASARLCLEPKTGGRLIAGFVVGLVCGYGVNSCLV